jgi:adenylate cyclase
MEDRLPRKLAAILYADVAGYSRLTGEDEDATHRALGEYLDLISSVIESHRGKVMHYAGDAVLAKFEAVVDSVTSATNIQKELWERNQDLPHNRRVEFRIGINLGDVIEDRGDIYGDGVNIAARLEGLADVGGICISESVKTAIGNKLALAYESMGEQRVKNIAEAIRAYRVSTTSSESRPSVQSTTTATQSSSKPSIAVMPFTNMSTDTENEFFADGMTEDIIGALSQLSALSVSPRNSTFMYKGKSVKVEAIAAELGVRYVLEGSVRKSGQRARITARLVDTAELKEIWTDRYDRKLDDIFELQDEITRNIAIALQVELSYGQHARIWQGGTHSFEAWECQIRGIQAFYDFTPQRRVEAAQLFERAVTIDPDFFPAWAALGYTHANVGRYRDPPNPDGALERAEEIAEMLTRREETRAEGLSLQGNIRLSQHRHEEAIAACAKAVELSPNNADFRGRLAFTLVYAVQPKEALHHLAVCLQLSPHYPNWFTIPLVLSHYLLGDLEEARNAAEDAIARFSDYIFARINLAGICGALSDTEMARGVAHDILQRQPDFSLTHYAIGLPFKDPTVLEAWLGHLRSAGLPD